MFDPHMRPPDDDDEPAFWFAVRRGQVLVLDGPDGPAIPHGEGPPPLSDLGERHVLGTLEGRPAWGVDVNDAGGFDDDPEGHSWVGLRQLYGRISDLHWTVAGRADQIVSWDRTHRFCGRCGEETEPQSTERARKCPACGQLSYPRLSPATITRVTRGPGEEEILLAWGRQFPGRFYSVLAGFVEPGESLEQCVIREIKEETGIDIDEVRYFGSQPWPFPHSLMIGFTARYVGGELELQEEEIVEAAWYRADALPPCPKGGMSIAGWLIEDWLDRRRTVD
jgi:NAD+ diphosphatase